MPTFHTIGDGHRHTTTL
uniref:Uncharacterized protein n=1 Tax=Oryza sativa subsp. indica TaxID=39946 RepID=C5NNQ0_ORYSI|nr:hypothetical protein [Oryza sativa Indica Group]